MKIRSVQFKFLITVISAMLAITVFVGGLSIYEVDNYIQRETENLINITCSNEAAQVNDIFGDIEKSVRIMESYVLSLFEESTADIEDRDKQNEILKSVGKMFVDVATNTDGAVAYYLRFDPEISDSKAGMFYSRESESNEYVSLEPTDLSIYDKNDTEHVGWFWQPYEAGRPIWLTPYYNQNNNILMISYVIPLYFASRFIGVVGMDFDYTVLSERIHQIKIYENGFAHLELDGVVIHDGNETEENVRHGSDKDYLQVSEQLSNGMTLVLSASYDDIRHIRYDIGYKILLIVVLFSFAFSVIVLFMVRKIMKPLKKLTDASIQLSRGNYDVEISQSDNYEIQQLSSAFENMIVNLREHERLQHMLAYRDSLTGLRNSTSYQKWALDFDKKVHTEQISFGILMLDINYLKETNDTYGHDVGNKLIATAAHTIADVFKRSPVFRIGGDEFLVILQNRDLEELDSLLSKFDSRCENNFIEAGDEKIPVSIAKGFSIFDPNTDTQFSQVFNRADERMYQNKKAMQTAQI